MVEQQQRIGQVQQEARQMVPERLQSKQLHVEHVGKPS
jgi:hypothetical protein